MKHRIGNVDWEQLVQLQEPVDHEEAATVVLLSVEQKFFPVILIFKYSVIRLTPLLTSSSSRVNPMVCPQRSRPFVANIGTKGVIMISCTFLSRRKNHYCLNSWIVQRFMGQLPANHEFSLYFRSKHYADSGICESFSTTVLIACSDILPLSEGKMVALWLLSPASIDYHGRIVSIPLAVSFHNPLHCETYD